MDSFFSVFLAFSQSYVKHDLYYELFVIIFIFDKNKTKTKRQKIKMLRNTVLVCS
jgi:hypothetical protein